MGRSFLSAVLELVDKVPLPPRGKERSITRKEQTSRK
jgi:hypothetical protein